MARTCVAILDEPLEPAAWLGELRPGEDVGAIATFVGLCRGEAGRLTGLELEHYPGMAEAEVERVVGAACERWPLFGLLAVHRTGLVAVGEPIVLVAAGASHRDAAFDAVRYVMDYLKTDAPFWKREHLADGTVGSWVAANVADDRARERWAVDA
ncbi:molybdenum cofactor biosynthesis protein MoaE [Acuticoccus sp.]|uniref:molybdenum cofactor biosynthesis protein MoaE n=1 Tax=Acuticoccus sp. TaxID=1904378 RepID=UPI003B5169E8